MDKNIKMRRSRRSYVEWHKTVFSRAILGTALTVLGLCGALCVAGGFEMGGLDVQDALFGLLISGLIIYAGISIMSHAAQTITRREAREERQREMIEDRKEAYEQSRAEFFSFFD